MPLLAAANARFAFNQSTIRLTPNEAIEQNLPPALAETIPNLPGIHGNASAVVCTSFSCQAPVADAEQLAQMLRTNPSEPAA